MGLSGVDVTNKIDQKITAYKVKTEEAEPEKQVLHEGIDRPESLRGKTYKVKPPQLDHALYITINDFELDGVWYPYEIFINTKDMSQFEWVVALTRVMSGVFRKGGSVDFLIEELKAVFSANGGYYKRGGVYMNSIVAEIGCVLEQHLQEISNDKLETTD